MNMTKKRKILSLLICIVLIAVTALYTVGCDIGKPKSDGTPKTFTFTVTDGSGKETSFEITTVKATVGEALFDEKLIEGEDSMYGLFVKKVNGIVADYDIDGTYWAFYVNGAYAVSGVDTTPVEDGAVYSFKVEK